VVLILHFGQVAAKQGDASETVSPCSIVVNQQRIDNGSGVGRVRMINISCKVPDHLDWQCWIGWLVVAVERTW
jgi:hypothetical protein